MKTATRFLVFFLLVLAPTAQAAPPRPAGASGTVVVPDTFLRRWDPVTIFFPTAVGPAQGGPEDRPTRYVSMTPAHPGAFTWLDARTLQFQPAEPWPPLQRFEWKTRGKRVRLTTLMSAPTRTIPSAHASGLDPVEQITLTFPEPLDVESLERMLTIELRSLPGVSSEAGSRWLTRDDFEIKVMERKSRSDSATYVVGLSSPIPGGTRAVVHLRLSLEDEAEESFTEVSFATAEPFRTIRVGCGNQWYPLTPEGSRYTRDQSLNCGSRRRAVSVEFSAVPRDLGPVEARNLMRFTPAVEGLDFSTSGRTLTVSGDFDWDTVYQVAVSPHPLVDVKGRPLQATGRSEAFFYFPRKQPYLKWGTGQGVVERLGPQMVPLDGRGYRRVDLRIHPVDGLDRSFWPFPDGGVVVDESQRPPGPGEEPPPHTTAGRHISTSELAEQLHALGSPPLSKIIELPLRREGSAASFGLDLEPHLRYLSGRNAPGTYLVGIRNLDHSSQRTWMRIQVTDLSLTTVEEAGRVKFLVTSLASGQPVRGATVRVQGARQSAWVTVHEGRTDADGIHTWTPASTRHPAQIRRITVSKGDDLLVLDATQPPQAFANDTWSNDYQSWLQWTQSNNLKGRGEQPRDLCHIFTERPVYRPDEKVYIKGYLRERFKGRLSTHSDREGLLVVDGPGDLQWRYPVKITEAGSFHHVFDEDKLPTGSYTARVSVKKRGYSCSVTFSKEAYRIPRFEVKLHGPDRVPLDREFEVDLTATYYAGGRVSGQDVRWRVTQFPYTWSPPQRDGFVYSSDRRFSGNERFQSSDRLDQSDVTGDDGSASLVLNPAIEPTAQPRSYVVEATVTGADDQSVTATRQVVALPPFVLGLKAPRYIEKAEAIRPEVLVVDHEGEPLAGQEVQLRLLHRQWHSHLRASDFSDGVARYVTDVVDEEVSSQKVVSNGEPLTVTLPIERSGVYIVELTSHDRLGRAQTVSVDLYAGGDEPVTWSKPQSKVFEVTTDRAHYAPGDTATLLLKSPFQQAHALAIVEEPEGNRYDWIRIRGGAASYRVPVRRTFVPRLPVHFILMRGRLPGTAVLPGSRTDLGKPATMASTTWVKVDPVENTVDVSLAYPEKAQPGDEIEVAIALKTPAGKPVAGEVTLWLVDQAVLALGREQRLDPVPDFITDVTSRVRVHDTRNMAIGQLAFAENPGGDEGEEASAGAADELLDQVTVRKRFETVPYYNPAIAVGATGRAVVKIHLPDNLTNFKLRAKAAAGPERFGFAKGHLAVRLPVIVQPALPRFVRPGDRFVAAAIGRIVEGDGGAGHAQMRARGIEVKGSTTQDFTWTPGTPSRLSFDVTVQDPPYDEEGKLAYDQVQITVGVERSSDQARDAFQVKLPVRDDRQRIHLRELVELDGGASHDIPALAEPARPGTVQRRVLISDQPSLIRMASGLDYLLDYPYGCTEQRIARARSQLALKKFRTLLHQEENAGALDRTVNETLQWIDSVVDDHGLVAYWPGSTGYVSLTAWTSDFLVEAREAGYAVDAETERKLHRSLQQALRSDYSYFIDGESWMERAWALSALANAGELSPSYASELARKSKYLDLEGVAQVLLALDRSKDGSNRTTDALTQELWDGLVFRLHQGNEIYGGLQWRRSARSGLILPSETRTVSEITRALARYDAGEQRFQTLLAGLVTLGRDDGWGSTNANAAALLALSEVLEPPFEAARPHAVSVSMGSESATMSTSQATPVGHFISSQQGTGRLEHTRGKGPVVARLETSYVPAGDGSTVASRAKGFVVSRTVLRVDTTGAKPPEKVELSQPGTTVKLQVGDVLEDHVQVVNPKDRHYVAVVVPLAAGMEPMNPNLETASSDATPTGSLTLQPTYTSFMDDHVAYYYNTLPKGTFDFYFRTQAAVPGQFIQPPARSEMMYDGAVFGSSNGARVVVDTAK